MQLNYQAINIERVTRNLVGVGSIPTRGLLILMFERIRLWERW